ncbi:MAG: hypothetical protein HRT89_18820 [Lentisphaeria bacterium]|nr:hypothetical protein [Lentisphaeria bacterium]
MPVQFEKSNLGSFVVDTGATAFAIVDYRALNNKVILYIMAYNFAIDSLVCT